MDDLQAGVRRAGQSPLPRQAAADAGLGCLVTARPGLDPLEAAFEADLANWLARLYSVRAERPLIGRLERMRSVGWLAVIAAILAVPMLGAVAAVAAVVLLVATLVVVRRAATSRSLERRDRRQRMWAPAAIASNDLPMFGPDERARLVRLMNLSRAAWRPATRMLLRAELRDARSCGSLANWGPLYDLEDVVLANAFAPTARSE
jgi:hypothetical protein